MTRKRDSKARDGDLCAARKFSPGAVAAPKPRRKRSSDFLLPLRAMSVLVVLECLANFLWHHSPRSDLVALLQTCSHVGPFQTQLLHYLDNTLGLVAHHEAWAVGESTVTFLVRAGYRAARMPRRGHVQPIDWQLMSDVGFLPWQVLQTLHVAGTVWVPAHSLRSFPTPCGHVQVEEMEAHVTYFGGHHAYWCLQVTTVYSGPAPSDSSETFSDSSAEA